MFFGEVKKALLTAATAVLITMAAAGPALALDPPKWVASVYVEAQKAVGLRWSPAAGATAYKVLRSTDKGKDYKEIGAPATSQYFDKDIEPGSTYYYVLQAVAGAEVSPQSEEKSITIPGKKQEAILPPEWDKITLQTTTEFGKTNFKVGLFWKGEATALAYNVYRSLEAGKGYELLSSTQDSKVIDDKVEGGKTYYYTVTALDAGFQETKPSAEQSIAVKAPEEEKKEGKKVIKALELVIKATNEFPRLTGGSDRNLDLPIDSVIAGNGDVYIANAGNSTVSIFSPDGAFKSKFGKRGAGEGEMSMIFGMGIDADDNLYICDAKKVSIFDYKGGFKKSFTLPMPEQAKYDLAKKDRPAGTREITPQPYDVAVAKDGNLLITDNAFSRVVITDSDGKYISEFGQFGFGDDDFKYPACLAVNSLGEICIADPTNRRCKIYTPDYKLKAIVGESKNLVGAFIGLGGVAVYENDDFIVTDPPMASIQVFSHVDGSYKFHFGDAKKTVDESSKGQRPRISLSNPNGVSYNPENKTLYVPLTQTSEVWIAKPID